MRIHFIALLVAMAPAASLAQSEPTLRDLTSVRAAGMGNATRGFASSGEALLTNPAGIAAVTRFMADASAQLDFSGGYRVFSSSAVDSALNAQDSFPLAGGVGYYNYRSGEGEERRTGSMVSVGLALPLYPDVLFVGVNGKYLRLGGAVDTNAVTLDAGVILRPVSILSLAAVGYNLVDIRSPEARRAWGFGAALGNDASFHLDVDARIDRNAADELIYSFSGGAEYLIGGVFMPRVGYSVDKLRDVREVTGGASLVVGEWALDLAYGHAVEGEGQTLGVALRLLNSPL